MIAQGNAISHGARAIEYSIDKDKARLVKVNDLPENIEPLAMWSRMMQHQHQCMNIGLVTTDASAGEPPKGETPCTDFWSRIILLDAEQESEQHTAGRYLGGK